MKRSTDPTLDQLMERDPQLAATVAAIRFESEEADRYQKERSFVWRHNGAFFTLGFLMVIACVVMLFTVVPSLDVTAPSGAPWFWIIIGTGFLGIFTILFTFVCSEARNAFTAALKVIGVIALVLLVGIPMYAAFLAGLHAAID